MGQWLRTACIGMALGSAHPLLAQGGDAVAAAPAHKSGVGMPLPLRPGERVEYFKDGCGTIVSALTPEFELSFIGRMNWHGACRFGLAHGPGVIAGGGYWTNSLTRLEFHYGYLRYNVWQNYFMANGKEQTNFFRSYWDKTGTAPAPAVWDFKNYSTINIPKTAYHLWLPRDGGYDHYSFNEVVVECPSIRPVVTNALVKRLPKAQIDSFVDWCKKGDDPHSISHSLWGADVHFMFRTYERTDFEGRPTAIGAKPKEVPFQTFSCGDDSKGCSNKQWAAMKGPLAAELSAQLKRIDTDYHLPQPVIDAITARFAPLEARRSAMIAEMAAANAAAGGGQ